MSNSIEVTVTLKDDERTLKQKFLCYDEIRLNPDSPNIAAFVKETMANFQGIPDKVLLKFTLEAS